MLIGFWNAAIRALATAFAYSNVFTAMTGLYLVVRRDVDHAPFDQVYLEPAVGVPQELEPVHRVDEPVKNVRDDRRSSDQQGNGTPDGSPPVSAKSSSDQEP
jgi:hypothetical protein